MAAATTLMGCLPTYSQIGNSAILLLLMVRMLQGLSVGGQLMSSLVFTLEGKPHGKWGVFGSAVMACTNVGTFLGGVVAYMLRAILKEEQLLSWGWRQPFLSGICISLCGIYLKYFCKRDEIFTGHHAPVPTSETSESDSDGVHTSATVYLKYFCKHDEIFTGHHAPVPTSETSESDSDGVHTSATVDHLTHANGNQQPSNPLRIAFSAKNRRSLLASSMVPMVWSGGFYLCFVWMAFYMTDLLRPPVPGAFGVNSCSLLLLALCFHLRVHFLTAPVDEL
jgi:MHS family proline/betaine transporter-like MFS transporter